MKTLKNSFVVLLLVLFVFSSFAMEKTISLKLEKTEVDTNEIIYPIELWKVTHESNLLCECYGQQGQKDIITVPGLTAEEISLYDKALDVSPKLFSNYYKSLSPEQKRILTIAAGEISENGTKKLNAQRLSCQLAKEWIDPAIIKQYIIEGVGICLPEFRSVMEGLKLSLFADNIRNANLIQTAVSSYASTIVDGTYLRKKMSGGAFKIVPPIKSLDTSSFYGSRDVITKFCNGEKYSIYAYMPIIGDIAYLVTSAKIYNKSISDLTEMNIWEEKLDKPIKTIRHANKINLTEFSPNGMWIAFASLDQLTLTCLDKSLINDAYLSHVTLINENSFALSLRFNNTSTILAYGHPFSVDLFDPVTKNCIASLNVGLFLPKNMEFNQDDSRLICFLDDALNYNKHKVIIWDVHDLKNITEFQKMEFSTYKECSNAIIRFNPSKNNIVAISTDTTTLFFDTDSGKCLAKTSELPSHPVAHTNVATTFIPNSPFACIAIKKDNESSYVQMYNYISGDCLGTISYEQPLINGLGMTKNFKSLIATFDGYETQTTKFCNDEEHKSYIYIADNLGLVDSYLLLQLFRAKKENRSTLLHPSLYTYLKESLTTNQTGKDLLNKYFFK
ncbi:MAG TPA: hypothetical protein VLB80_03655 [Candidatus Babeliales bacterium]|nr:hypothetical protein [Candidatus Babeliales bacterium]